MWVIPTAPYTVNNPTCVLYPRSLSQSHKSPSDYAYDLSYPEPSVPQVMHSLTLGGEPMQATLNDLKPNFFSSALLDIHHLCHHNRHYPRPYLPLCLRRADSNQRHRFGHGKGMTPHSFASSRPHLLRGSFRILARWRENR